MDGERSEFRDVFDGFTSNENDQDTQNEFNRMLQDLSAPDEPAKDDHKERSYQTFLINFAKERNIIACLPTGSGKTFIALQLTKFHLPEAIKNKQKIVFLANTVPLVNQQAEYFRSVLSNTFVNKDTHHVECLTGDRNVDVWDILKWKEILENCNVMVMTTQILDDALNHKYMVWSDIIFLVLDECHHTDKDHAMNRVMSNYRNAKANGEEKLPKVLGLTATIINGKKNIVENEVQDAEYRLAAVAVTYHKYEEVLKHSTSATIDFVLFSSDISNHEWSRRNVDILKSLKDFEIVLNQTNEKLLFENDVVKTINHHSLTDSNQVYNQKKELKKLKSIVQEVLGVYTDLGPYCAKIASLNKRAWLQVAATVGLSNKHLEYFYLALDTALQRFVCSLDYLMSGYDVTDQMEKFISSKLRKLLELLKGYKPKDKSEKGHKENMSGEDLCGIVFVEKRITAQCLAFYFLDIVDYNWPPYNFIHADFVVGSSRFDLDPDEMRITTRKQNEVIQKFHLKKINLLIATNVIEEGLNVPACNIVVRFDKIQTYPSFVQSMGRARKEKSKFHAFVNQEEEAKQRQEYHNFEVYNRKLSDYLRQKALHADEDDEQCDENMEKRIDEEIPPFEPTKGQAPRITALESISIANRYCQALPSDRIVTLAPFSWWAEIKTNATAKKQFRAYVLFPSNSVLRDIVEGDIYENKVLAKRSAFLKACIQLYKLNVLDDRLFPKSHKIVATIEKFMEVEGKVEEDHDGRKVGSRKRTQRYLKKIPDCFQLTKVAPEAQCKVYQIVLEQYTAKDDEISKSLYQFSKRQVAFGFLTPVDLSIIPKFLLDAGPAIGFLTFSLKEISLKSTEKGFTVEAIKQLCDFERYIFGDLLELKRNVMQASENTSILVIPLQKSEEEFQINWALIDKVSNIGADFFNVPTPKARQEFTFKVSDYEDAVLVPWYRGDLRLLHTVLGIWEGTTPLSHFVYHSQWPDFKSYFLEKYSTTIDSIRNMEQPLVRAKLVGKNLNFFTRKAIFKSTKEERKDQRNNIIELLPELCIIHPMPASLYIQSKCIPSILHRMARYLCAKEIQSLVAKDSPWSSAQMDGSKSFTEEKCNLNSNCHPRCTDNIISSEKKQESEQTSEDVSTANGHGDGTKSVTVGVMKPTVSESGIDAGTGCDNGDAVQSARKDPLFLDFLHPGRITHHQLDEIRTRNEQKRDQKKNQNLVTNGTDDWRHEKETNIELVDINSLEFESLDQEFDFSKNEQPSLYKIMEAITMEGSRDHMSLERLETMGDSFLKYCVSRHVFSQFPNDDEGALTKLRSQLVSNAFLYQHGKKTKLGEYLAAGIFVPESAWMPLTYKVPSSLAEAAARHDLNEDVYMDVSDVAELESMTANELDDFITEKKKTMKLVMPANTGLNYVRVADKSIADSVEALIGAYYTAGSAGAALHFMKQIGLRAPKENGELLPFGQWEIPKPKLVNVDGDAVEKHIPLYRELEGLICYEFKEPWLLVEAFTHPCYMANRVTQCYQRLEFLGDAVLDFLITNHIYKAFNGQLDPGDLTDLRSALVNNVTFGSLAVRYGLHTYLLHTSKQLQDAIDLFADHQKSVGHEVTGHFKLLSDWDCPTVTVQDIDHPKVLGDIFESLAGAIYLDSGMSLDTVWRVMYRLMLHEIDLFSKSIPKSPVRELYETYPRTDLFSDYNPPQENDNGLTYVLLTVPLIVPTAEGAQTRRIVGAGNSKQSAKLGAAKYAMKLKNEFK